MNDKNALFENLRLCCLDMIDSKIILSKIKLENLLSYIASSPELVDFFRKCCQGINFYNELNNCYARHPAGVRFALPNSNRTIIVIVLGILDEVEKGDMLLTEFLTSVYPAIDTDTAYHTFGTQFVLPFIDAVYNLFIMEAEMGADAAEELASVGIDALKAAVTPILNSFNTLITADNSLRESTRQEYFDMVSAAFHSIESTDLYLIKTSYVALDIVLSKQRQYKKPLRELRRILTEFHVLTDR